MATHELPPDHRLTQRRRNLRLAWILVSVAVAFMLGFWIKMIWLRGG